MPESCNGFSYDHTQPESVFKRRTELEIYIPKDETKTKEVLAEIVNVVIMLYRLMEALSVITADVTT